MQDEQKNSDLKEEESRRLKHDADAGSDGSPEDILQTEKQIDIGNEHHQSADDKSDALSGNDADSGSDATGTTGPEPGEGENDQPDTSGEDG